MINCCVDQKTTTKHEYEISGIQRKYMTLQSVIPPASHGWDHHIFVHPPSSHGYPVVGLPDITNSKKNPPGKNLGSSSKQAHSIPSR
jgi:NADH:ubiquinone oxidoreductase subunit